MDAHMRLGPYIFVDTETTGFRGQKHACIAELGAVAVDLHGREVGVFSSLVKPIFPWSDAMLGGLNFCGIEKDQVMAAPDSTTVWNGFYQWVRCMPANPAVVAWNQPFDKGMFELHAWSVPWAPFDPMIEYKKRHNLRKGYKLIDAAARYGIETGTSHRALDDARTLAGVWQGMCDEVMIG